MSHWAGQYIGLPYQEDAFGPDAFNCWTFLFHVQQIHFGRSLPFAPDEIDVTNILAIMRRFSQADLASLGWHPVTVPEDGDVVFMGHGKKPHHVGIFADINRGGIVHCVEGQGVVFARPSDPATRMSWRLIEYYRYLG